MGASLPKADWVRSSTTGMSLRARLMSLAACETVVSFFMNSMGWRCSKRPVRAAMSSRVIWMVCTMCLLGSGGLSGRRRAARSLYHRARLQAWEHGLRLGSAASGGSSGLPEHVGIHHIDGRARGVGHHLVEDGGEHLLQGVALHIAQVRHAHRVVESEERMRRAEHGLLL